MNCHIFVKWNGRLWLNIVLYVIQIYVSGYHCFALSHKSNRMFMPYSQLFFMFSSRNFKNLLPVWQLLSNLICSCAKCAVWPILDFYHSNGIWWKVNIEVSCTVIWNLMFTYFLQMFSPTLNPKRPQS